MQKGQSKNFKLCDSSSEKHNQNETEITFVEEIEQWAHQNTFAKQNSNNSVANNNFVPNRKLLLNCQEYNIGLLFV